MFISGMCWTRPKNWDCKPLDCAQLAFLNETFHRTWRHTLLWVKRMIFHTSSDLTNFFLCRFRNNSKISWSKSTWNCHFVFGTARGGNLWSISSALFSTQSAWRVKCFVAVTQKRFRDKWWTQYFWSANTHHS